MKLGVHVLDINLAPFPFAICFLYINRYWAVLPPKHVICWSVIIMVPLLL